MKLCQLLDPKRLQQIQASSNYFLWRDIQTFQIVRTAKFEELADVEGLFADLMVRQMT
ncbi:hypothetical protein [Fischerella sp. PCC 9605]|uniref:hypothetical protein n=1 Tax=Fischerella sp. PCC 9605 TaxID=1173024 RepID=UPI0004AED869|nr:hypothetical protein [Fischerella sp. PCC 9605]